MSMIQEYEAFGSLLGQVTRVWRKAMNESLAEFGLTEGTWRPLIYLFRAVEPLSQNDLAELMGLDRSSVVRLLDVLQRAGYVTRQEDTQDRRIKRLHLTQAGTDVALQVKKASQQVLQQVFDAIPDDLLSSTQSGLQQILQLLSQPR